MFWTTTVRPDDVRVDPTGAAVFEVNDLAQKDFVTFEGAILGGTKVRQGQVSFRVEWTATGAPQLVDNPTQRYRAVVREADAKMAWTARTPEYELRSGPMEESSSDTALLAQESNGSYY